MVITNDNQQEILKLKQQLSSQFHMKDSGELSYFIGLEIVRTAQGVFVSQKILLDLIKKTAHGYARALRFPMDPLVKLTPNQGCVLTNGDNIEDW